MYLLCLHITTYNLISSHRLPFLIHWIHTLVTGAWYPRVQCRIVQGACVCASCVYGHESQAHLSQQAKRGDLLSALWLTSVS